MKIILLSLLLSTGFCLYGQSSETQEVINTIESMFDAMRESDSTKLLSVMHGDVELKTTYTDRSGNPQIKSGSIQDFAKSIATPHDQIYDEKIWSYEVEIDGSLASAWTEYTFYLGEQMSHCGVNAFQLFKTNEGWKIISITDTRRKEGCQTAPSNHTATINQLMDNWHKAAAKADEDTFFGTMSADGIYLGTDASERWLRDELKEWSKKFFERESAWAFTPKDRVVYFSNDGKTAWFEELLETWMGDCRGSGVLEWTKDGWKLNHYNLAMLVPNDKVQEYLKLFEKK